MPQTLRPRDDADDPVARPDLDREIRTARRAVQRAHEQVTLARGPAHGPPPVVRPADASRLTARAAAPPRKLPPEDARDATTVETALTEAERRARRPFGRTAAKRVVSLELAKRLIFERVGLARDDGLPGVRPPVETAPTDDDEHQPPPIVDLLVLGAAYEELTRAEDRLAVLIARTHPVHPALPHRRAGADSAEVGRPS